MKYRLAAVALIAHPAVASAHGLHAEGFGAGFTHPFGGLDHFLTMVLVGICGVVLGRRMVWAMPLAFVGAVAMGLVFAGLGPALSWTEIAVVLSPLSLGLALLGGRSIPRAGALVLAAGLGFCHGHVHGIELGDGAVLFSTAAGVLLGTAVLHMLGFFSVMLTREGLRERATRLAGVAASLAGLTLLLA